MTGDDFVKLCHNEKEKLMKDYFDQESSLAVSNIIKYSDNDSVDIRIDEHPSMYQIIVRDYDSLGHSKDNEGEEVEIDHRGMGLDNIIKRAEQFNGQAYFTKGNGFRVFVRLGKNI